jgi:hypothetical protein
MVDDQHFKQAPAATIVPTPSADEAAAIVAALECFAGATATAAATGGGGDPWQRAALLEGVSHKAQPVTPSAWMA